MSTQPDYSVIQWEIFNLPEFPHIPLRRAVTKDKHPQVPTIEPHVFTEEHLSEFATCVWPSDDGDPQPLLLSGPTGSGKTSFILQLAARCNVPVFRVNLNGGTTVRQLKGSLAVRDGATYFNPGVATMAMEFGGWLLLDELSAAVPPVAMSLFPILEPRGAVLLEQAQPVRCVTRHPHFRVFATDNTIGANMEAARFAYRGTNPDQNVALIDRFGGMCELTYLGQSEEFDIMLQKVPDIHDVVLEGLIRVANLVRDSEDAPPFSTRMVENWARRIAMVPYRELTTVEVNTKKYQSDPAFIMSCASGAFLRKQRTNEQRTIIQEIIVRIFGEA